MTHLTFGPLASPRALAGAYYRVVEQRPAEYDVVCVTYFGQKTG